jgi:flagellar biosynthesis protein FliR
LIDIDLEAQKFILIFFRVLSVLWLLPLFQTRSLSMAYKAGLSLLIAFLLLGPISIPDFQNDPYLLLLGIAKEVLIGLSIGFVVRVVFAMVSAAGEIISFQAGLSFARTMDPTQAMQVTVLDQFKGLLATMIFLGIDGHHIMLRSLSASLGQIPPGAAVIRPGLFQYLINSTGGIFAAGLKICAPVVVTLFLVELALGLIARMIPQVNVFIEGASLKILIALGMLAVSLNLIVPVIGVLFRNTDGEILKIMRLLAA